LDDLFSYTWGGGLMDCRFSLRRRKLVLGSLATAGAAATGSLATVQALGAEEGLINLQLGYIAGADQIA
jgi:NitT/TauT family transport system substrate-binding protein